MRTRFLALPGSEEFTDYLSRHLGCTAAVIEVHRFPDGEQAVKLDESIAGCRAVLVGHLDHPDEKTLPLLFAADAVRELGAAEVGLVAPYLPYMQQDARFRPGQAITSRSYARLLCRAFDFLVTVDPHLHRWHALEEIYSIPATVVTAGPAIAAWIGRELPGCVLIGPDPERAEWAAGIAAAVPAPFFTLERTHLEHGEVELRIPENEASGDRTPVLLDDLASPGGALAAAAQVLRAAGWRAPVIVTVHALLHEHDAEMLRRAGVARIVSCDTIPHRTNAISVRKVLADALGKLCEST